MESSAVVCGFFIVSHTLLLCLFVSECVHVCTCMNLFPMQSYGCLYVMLFNQQCAFALLLFANVIRLRQGCSSLLAPLQSELLICFSVRVTFVKPQHPRPALRVTSHCSLKNHYEKTLSSLKQ